MQFYIREKRNHQSLTTALLSTISVNFEIFLEIFSKNAIIKVRRCCPTTTEVPMKTEYKQREKFVRTAGSALASLGGVNNKLDFSYILIAKKLIKYSEECEHFNEQIQKYRILTEENPTNTMYAMELEGCIDCIVKCENAFIDEARFLQEKYGIDVINNTIWQLEQLAKCASVNVNRLNTTYKMAKVQNILH